MTSERETIQLREQNRTRSKMGFEENSSCEERRLEFQTGRQFSIQTDLRKNKKLRKWIKIEVDKGKDSEDSKLKMVLS